MSTYKQFAFSSVEKQKVSDTEHKVVISTDSPDRHEDVVVSEGIQYEKYLKNNPVVLFQHGHDFQVGSAPIARAKSMKTFRHKVESSFEFAKEDEHAERIENLWTTGFLNAASIGALVIKAEDMEVKDKDDIFSQLFPPQRILECELLEYSLVTLPANSGALRKELDVQLLTLIQKIEEKLVPVEEILKKAQEIDAQIKLLKEIETHIDNDQVDEKFVPWVSYKFTDSPWSALFLSDTETDFSFSYAYQSCAPHHSIEDGNIVTSFSAVCMGLAMINGTKKDIEGAQQAYAHLAKHYQEKKHTAPDYAYKQWTPLQVTSFLRSESVNEDHILMTLTDCGLSTEEALKLVKPVQEKKEVVEEKSSDDFDQMLNEILAGCKDIVSLVI